MFHTRRPQVSSFSSCSTPRLINCLSSLPSDESDELYINMNGKKANRKLAKVADGVVVKKEEVNEDVRTEIMANKHKHKKNKRSDRGIQKREEKRAMQQKMQKRLVTAGKALKNGAVKHEKTNGKAEPIDVKPDQKIPLKPVYNSDGKLVFSKFDFAAGTTALIKNKKSE